jgi:hypothetical protein
MRKLSSWCKHEIRFTFCSAIADHLVRESTVSSQSSLRLVFFMSMLGLSVVTLCGLVGRYQCFFFRA